MTTGKPWTYPEIDRLRHLRVVERKAYDEIGLELDRSASSVKGKYHSSGLAALSRPAGRPLVETMAVSKTEVVRLYELGWRFDGFSSTGLCIMSKKTQFVRPYHVVAIVGSSSSADVEPLLGASV